MEINSVFLFYTLFYIFPVKSIVIPVCPRILVHFIWAWFYMYEFTFGNPAVRPGACSENVPDCSRKKTERAVEKICNFFAICICLPLYLYKNILQ